MDDIEAIKQLTARYNLTFDEDDVEGWLDCWTQDGFFERSNAGRSYTGHEELHELATEFPVSGRHVTSEYVISVDGDEGRQVCYLLYLDREKNFEINMFGVYDDAVVRQDDGRWRFKSRRLKIDEGSSA
jgi:hypothetical protein